MQTAHHLHRQLSRPAAEASPTAQRWAAFSTTPLQRRRTWLRRPTAVSAKKVSPAIKMRQTKSCACPKPMISMTSQGLEHTLASGAGQGCRGAAVVRGEAGTLPRAQRLDRRLGRSAVHNTDCMALCCASPCCTAAELLRSHHAGGEKGLQAFIAEVNARLQQDCCYSLLTQQHQHQRCSRTPPSRAPTLLYSLTRSRRPLRSVK